MTNLFGDNYPITLHTYDYIGMAPRPYNSFYEMADDIGMSRVYAGITIMPVWGEEDGGKKLRKERQSGSVKLIAG